MPIPPGPPAPVPWPWWETFTIRNHSTSLSGRAFHHFSLASPKQWWGQLNGKHQWFITIYSPESRGTQSRASLLFLSWSQVCYLVAKGHHFQQEKTDPTLLSWPSHWPLLRLDYCVQVRQQHLQQHFASYFLSHLHRSSARGSPHWASDQIQQSRVSNHDCPWLLWGCRPTLKHGWLCSSAVFGFTCANCLNKLVKWFWSAWPAQMAFWVSPPGCCQLPTPGVWRSGEETAASPLSLLNATPLWKTDDQPAPGQTHPHIWWRLCLWCASFGGPSELLLSCLPKPN